MRPLNVVLLIDELEVWGGTETHLLRLLLQLDPERIRPVLATIGRSAIADVFRAKGTAVHELRIHRTFAPSGALGLAKIGLLLRREQASLLVTYHTSADLLGPVAARALGVPVLSCRRDEGFTKKAVHRKAQRAVNHWVTGLIVVSRAVADAVARAEGYPTKKMQVIWNGEDLQRFSPGQSGLREELKLSAQDVLITTVGSLTPAKDHRSLLLAFDAAAREHPELRLLVVGEGPLRGDLERQTAALSASSRVHFLGHRQDVPDLLRASDLYLQTSSTEGFSNSILQAMACALPVVVTSVGGNVELVSTECGWLAPPRDVPALSRAVSALASDRDLRSRLGLAGRARAEAWGSLARMAEAYTDAFERAVEGRFPAPPLERHLATSSESNPGQRPPAPL